MEHLLHLHRCSFLTPTHLSAVLIHCGAGVSRSASLCIAFLMRDRRITAHEALQLVKERRSIAEPNDGFWRMLCALEGPLGLQQRYVQAHLLSFSTPRHVCKHLCVHHRSDVKELSGHPGRDASSAAASVVGKVSLAQDAAGAKVEVCWVPLGGGSGEGQVESQLGDVGRKRQRSRSRERNRSHSRERQRSPEGRRVRFEEPSGRRRSPPPNGSSQQAPTPRRVLPDPFVVLEVQREGKVLGEYQFGKMAPSQTVLFGRLPTCDVHLEHLSISRQHAQLQLQRGGSVTLTDMGSGHGTNIDGVWVRANAPKVLRIGTVIKLGASTRALVVKQLPKGAQRPDDQP